MITVLRVAQELTSVNYRKWFYHRWLPPSDRSVRLAPARTDPAALLPTPPDGPGKGLAPQESPTATNMVQRLRPMLRHLLGNLVSITDQDDAVTKSPASAGGDNSDRSGRGEKRAKPPWSSSAERFAKSTSGTEGDPVDQPVPLDQDASSMLSYNHDGSPVIPLLVTEVDDEDIPSSGGYESYPHRKPPTTAPRDDRGGDTNVGEAMASQPTSSSEENDDDDEDDDDDDDDKDDDDHDDDEGDDGDDDDDDHDHDDEGDPKDEDDGDEDDDDDADDNTDDDDKEDDDDKDEDDDQDDDDDEDDDDDDEDDDDTDDGGEDASSSPQSLGDQLSNKEESLEQEETVREVMKKVKAMMAQPSHPSGESGSEPQWMKALRIAEAMLAAQPRQPVLRHRSTPPTAGESGKIIVQPTTGPQPDLQESAEPAPHQPLTPPTLPRGGPWQPPKSVLALRLVQQTNPWPHLPQPRHQHIPTPQPTTTTKRRLMNLRRSPLDINGRKRSKQVSSVSTARAGGACAPPSHSHLPAESSFISVLKEIEFEDVLTRGQPTCLGSGVFGEVMLKRRKTGGALMAFKSLQDVDDPLKAYQEMVEEVRVMMAVQHHREFPKVLGIVNQTTFAVEFVGDAVTKQSRHLRSAVDYPPANLTVLGWIQICLDIARGLRALHHAGWSHNDLHTRNVMVWRDPNNRSDENWGAKIIDLGKATRIDNPPPPHQYDDNTKTYCFRNCIHVDPELIEGNCRRGVKTDIFSLGFVFSVVSFNKPELGVIESIYRHCSRVLKDRPTMESIIQDIEGFQTDMMKKALSNIRRRRGGALA